LSLPFWRSPSSTPAGRDLDPAIPAADQAIDEGSLTPVVKLLTTSMEDGLRAHFEEAVTTKKFKPGDVNAGRGSDDIHE
jgi:hypothetical protein